MSTVKIYPSGDIFNIDSETNVLSLLREKGVYVKSSCGGHASCTDCVVKILRGEEFINTPNFDELKLLGNVFHITKERLSCQLQVREEGEIEIDLSRHDKASDEKKMTQKRKQFIRTKVKKKADIVQEQVEKVQRREESRQERDLKEAAMPKRLDGGRRVRPFIIPENDGPSKGNKKN